MQLNEENLKSYLATLGIQSSDGALLIREFKHGQSNPTYFIRYGGRELVLRKKPPGKLLPMAHMVEREYEVKKALGAAGVPVPGLLALCEDNRFVANKLHTSYIDAYYVHIHTYIHTYTEMPTSPILSYFVRQTEQNTIILFCLSKYDFPQCLSSALSLFSSFLFLTKQ